MLAERPHGLSKVVRIRILIFCIKPIRVYRCSLRLFLFFKRRMSAHATILSIMLLLASGCVGVLAISNAGPVITLSYGSFQGNLTGDVVEFLGIPFAAPPYASCPFLSFDDIEKYLFFAALGISDLLPLNCLWILLESARLLVLDQLARSKQ